MAGVALLIIAVAAIALVVAVYRAEEKAEAMEEDTVDEDQEIFPPRPSACAIDGHTVGVPR